MKNEIEKINRKHDLVLSEAKKLQNSNAPPGSEEIFTIGEASQNHNPSKSVVYAFTCEGNLFRSM